MLEKFESGESESDFARQGSEDSLASRSDGTNKVFKTLQNINICRFLTIISEILNVNTSETVKHIQTMTGRVI